MIDRRPPPPPPGARGPRRVRPVKPAGGRRTPEPVRRPMPSSMPGSVSRDNAPQASRRYLVPAGIAVAVLFVAVLIGLSSGRRGGGQPHESTYELQLEQERIERERASKAREFARSAGSKIMGQIGGGQDLVVDVDGYDYDEFTDEYEIDMTVEFNGAIFRNNHYWAEGRLICTGDGGNPQFSLTDASDSFHKIQGRLKLLAAGAATVIVLDELSKQ